MSGEVRDLVRARYGEAARRGACGCASEPCCGEADAPACGARLYPPEERAGLPDGALRAALGCGNPVAVAELREGEVVLDLGSGGGIDVLLSARRVGPTGFVYGLDMTDEMLELARRNAREAGVENVRFLRGFIEAVPLPDASVDVVISNCVVNLSPEKRRVFDEVYRVLRPGGRVGISDVVAADRLTPAERVERGSWTGCVAGALSFEEYRAGLEAAGFAGVEVVPTHEVADGMFGAIIRARKPGPEG
ncbi:MAG TPA: arsenite methyltransferase [Actinomycetota bacterium]|nr:arsenite methyltransferase [Actinomycetota bacterium]